MPKKAGLGRGMNAILGSGSSEYTKRKSEETKAAEAKAPVGNGQGVSMLRVSLIEPNRSQPRKIFDEAAMKELSDSIRQHGVLQPILVRKNGQMYEIIVGERRWRAARQAGLKEIPAVIRDMDTREAAEAALIENIQREDLGTIEEARAYKALIEEYGLTQEELAERLSKSRTAVTNSLRLLQLEESILALIESGALTAGHARAVLSVNGSENRKMAAEEIVEKGLSVRQAEKLARGLNRSPESKKEKDISSLGEQEKRTMFISAAENELAEIMNTKVIIRQTGRSCGRIEIEYYSEDELNSLIDRLKQ